MIERNKITQINIQGVILERLQIRSYLIKSGWEVLRKSPNENDYRHVRIGIIYQAKTEYAERAMGHQRFKFRYWFGEKLNPKQIFVARTRKHIIDMIANGNGMDLS